MVELTEIFNEILDGIIEKGWDSCPSDTGLDDETREILNSLAAQPNPKRPVDIQACRTEFGRMLDGTHAREAAEQDDAEWDQLF